MEGPDSSWSGGDEGEEKSRGKPIYDARVCRVEVCSGVGDGGEGEPLSRRY